MGDDKGIERSADEQEEAARDERAERIEQERLDGTRKINFLDDYNKRFGGAREEGVVDGQDGGDPPWDPQEAQRECDSILCEERRQRAQREMDRLVRQFEDERLSDENRER